MTRYLKTKLVEIACMTPLLYGGLVGWIKVSEPALIFPGAHRQRPDIKPDLGAGFRALTIEIPDGITLAADVAEPTGHGADAWWCLFCEGQWGLARWDLPKIAAFRQAGLGVVCFDYRGYGKSTGTPDEQGLYRDAQAVYSHLIKERHVRPDRVIVYGSSLGSGVAVELAARRAVAALIVDGAYTSVPARGQEVYPWLPVRWIASNQFDSLSKIREIKVPKLFMHGRFDQTIPMRHGRALFEAAEEPKRWAVFDGGHEDFPWSESERFGETIREFLASLTSGPSSSGKHPSPSGL